MSTGIAVPEEPQPLYHEPMSDDVTIIQPDRTLSRTLGGSTGFGSPIAEHPAPLEIETFQSTLPGLRIALPDDAVIGLLRPFSGHARKTLAVLLAGGTLGMAAAAVPMSKDTLDNWRRRHPQYDKAVRQALDWGFAQTYEAELYSRALDRADRGSMRALELVVKSRDASYRDKQTGTLEVVHRMVSGVQRMIDGPPDTIDPRAGSE